MASKDNFDHDTPRYITEYVENLRSRTDDDLEKELAELSFDLSFIEAQMQAVQRTAEEYSVVENGKEKILQLRTKMEKIREEMSRRYQSRTSDY